MHPRADGHGRVVGTDVTNGQAAGMPTRGTGSSKVDSTLMIIALLLSVVVALIMLVGIRFWGRPPRMNRVWIATALSGAIALTVIRTMAAIAGPSSTWLWLSVAVAAMGLWLLKMGHDYTKTSKKA